MNAGAKQSGVLVLVARCKAAVNLLDALSEARAIAVEGRFPSPTRHPSSMIVDHYAHPYDDTRRERRPGGVDQDLSKSARTGSNG